MLTGPEILNQIKLGNIVIDPFDPVRINPNSYNLRLGDKLLVYKDWERMAVKYSEAERLRTGFCHGWSADDTPAGVDCYGHPDPPCLDMARDNPTTELTIPETGLVLFPGVLYLGATMEYTETKCFVPRLDGRSSIGRLGLCIHVTAAYGDVGYCGKWTTELTVIHPLRIYPGAAICQISYSPVVGEIRPYVGKYQNANGAQASRLHQEFAAKLGSS